MKITKTVLACLAVLAFFALTTRSARAGEMDCKLSSCAFSSVTPTTVFLNESGTGLLTGLSLTENIYDNSGVYTYVFQLQDAKVGGSSGLNSEVAFTILPGFSADSFNPSLKFGLITDETNNGATGSVGCGGTGIFCFGSAGLTVGFGAHQLNAGQEFTFYAQGDAYIPNDGQLKVTDGHQQLFTADTPVPEPGVLTLLASLLLVLGLGMPFAFRLRTRTA